MPRKPKPPSPSSPPPAPTLTRVQTVEREFARLEEQARGWQTWFAAAVAKDPDGVLQSGRLDSVLAARAMLRTIRRARDAIAHHGLKQTEGEYAAELAGYARSFPVSTSFVDVAITHHERAAVAKIWEVLESVGELADDRFLPETAP